MTDVRDIWASIPPSGEHVDEADWERYALGEVDAAERGRIVAHVGGCPRCARAWRAVHLLAEEARALDPSLPTPSAPPRERPGKAWWRAASAVLAVAAAVLLFVALRREPAPEVMRGAPRAAIELRVSAAQVAWTAVPDADAYRVRVFSEDGRPVLDETTRATETTWAQATPGSYSWSVEALRRGDVIARSRLAPFHVAR